MSELHPTFRQFLKFGIVGGCGFVVDYSFLSIGIYVLGIGQDWAAFFSFPFAVTFTWLGNRFFTFKGARHQSAHKQLVKFASVCAVGLIFNRGTYLLFMHCIPLVYAYLPVLDHYPALERLFGLMAGTLVGMFFNFFAAKKHVFGA